MKKVFVGIAIKDKYSRLFPIYTDRIIEKATNILKEEWDKKYPNQEFPFEIVNVYKEIKEEV